MNLYSYSAVHKIGVVLQRPFVNLVSGVVFPIILSKYGDASVCRIGKFVLHLLVAVVFIIPVILSWCLGKLINCFSKSRIDYFGLTLMSQGIPFPQKDPTHLIDLEFLADQFDMLLKEETIGDLTHNTIKTNFRAMLVWIKDTQKRSTIDAEDQIKILFCRELARYLEAIIIKIQLGEVSYETTESVLKKLSEIPNLCASDKFKTILSVYEGLIGKLDGGETKILKYVQDYKEAIILEFCQLYLDDAWNGFNAVRNVFREELGWNMAWSRFNPTAGSEFPALSRALMRWFFLQRYQDVNRLIAIVHRMIISRKKYDPELYDLLLKIVRKRGNTDDPISFVNLNLYKRGTQELKPAGVNMMLRAVRIIK